MPLAPSGAMRLRLRLRHAPGIAVHPASQPAEPLSAAAEADAPSELLGEARDVASSFASWASALEDMSASFAAREPPEDPEHPEGAGPQHPASVPRGAHLRPAGVAEAVAEGLLPPSAADVAGEAAFQFDAPGGEPATATAGIGAAAAAFDAAEAEPGGAGGGYALVEAPGVVPPGGERSDELWDEEDRPDAEGEDERRQYYRGDVAEPQEYGSESDDPYARSSASDDEMMGDDEESSSSDFDEEGNLLAKEP